MTNAEYTAEEKAQIEDALVGYYTWTKNLDGWSMIPRVLPADSMLERRVDRASRLYNRFDRMLSRDITICLDDAERDLIMSALYAEADRRSNGDRVADRRREDLAYELGQRTVR